MLVRALGLVGPLLLGAAFAAFSAPPASAPSLAFDQPRAEFGSAYQRSVVEQTYPFVNQGAKPVTILAVRPRMEGGTGEAVPRVVPSGGHGEIRVRQPVGDRLGASAFRIALDTDDPAAPLLRLGLSGFVESAYEPQAPKLDFGTVFRESGGLLALDLASREVERLEIRSVEGAPSFLEVSTAERSGESGEGIRLSVRLKPGAPIGPNAGSLILSTNVKNQPQVAVQFAAVIYGDIVPEHDPVSFGLVRVGEGYEARVSLTSRSGAPFEIESVVDPEGRVAAESAPCPAAEASKPCRQLTLRGLALVAGPFGGTVTVRISGQDAPLPLRYAGLAASPNARIKTLDFSALPPSEVDAPRLPFVPVTAAAPIPGAEAPTDASGAARPVALLRWQASNEEGVFGYRVLRSTSRLGPFVRVNRELILVPAETKTAHSYVFQDFDVAPGVTYYYYLDLVTTSGEVRRFSGVLPKTVSSAPGSPRTNDASTPPNEP